MQHRIWSLTCLLFLAIPFASWTKRDNAAAGKTEAKVLIVGLNDNVKSNYYYNEQIASETGMKADSIDQQYNSIIAQNIAAANSPCKFVTGSSDPSYDGIIGKIEVSGEGEACKSSLTNITTEELRQALDHAHADYLLVLNQHYLKWQEQPMRTVFHMVNYTLYNKEKKQVYTGSQYFTTMNLETPEKIVQISRRSSSKIASSIARSLDL